MLRVRQFSTLRAVLLTYTNHYDTIKIMKTRTLIALAAGLIGCAGTANAALTFTWRIAGDGQYGTSIATVGGQLTLNDTGTQATSLTVEFAEGGDIQLPPAGTNFVIDANTNSFTVSDNTITDASFGSNINGNPNYSLSFGYYGNYNSYNTSLYDYSKQSFVYFETVDNRTGLSGVNFTSAVPEPSALALLGLGTVGFIARRRRN